MKKPQFKMEIPNDLKTKLFVMSCMNDTSISEEIIRIIRKELDQIESEDSSSKEKEFHIDKRAKEISLELRISSLEKKVKEIIELIKEQS